MLGSRSELEYQLARALAHNSLLKKQLKAALEEIKALKAKPKAKPKTTAKKKGT